MPGTAARNALEMIWTDKGASSLVAPLANVKRGAPKSGIVGVKPPLVSLGSQGLLTDARLCLHEVRSNRVFRLSSLVRPVVIGIG